MIHTGLRLESNRFLGGTSLSAAEARVANEYIDSLETANRLLNDAIRLSNETIKIQKENIASLKRVIAEYERRPPVA